MSEVLQGPKIDSVITLEGGLTIFERNSLIVLGCCTAWTLITSIVFVILKFSIQKVYPPKFEDEQLNAEEAVGVNPNTQEKQRTYYCFSCADFRAIEDKFQSAHEDQGFVRMGMSCSICSHLMVHYNWLPRLLEFFIEYRHPKYKNVSRTFPLSEFLSKWDYISILMQLSSGAINCATTAYKVRQLPERDRSSPYNLTLIIIPWLELGAVVGYLCYLIGKCMYIMWKSHARGPLNNPLRAFLIVFIPQFPSIANVNAFGMVRLWDFQRVTVSTFREGSIETAASPRLIKLLSYFFFLSRLPFLLFLCFIPALAIFIRILQLAGPMQTYVGYWGPTQWIVFLGFLNNIRSIANRQEPLPLLFKHLVGERIYTPFMDITNQTGTWWTCASVLFTSPPQELYRLFIDNGDLLYPASEVALPTAAQTTKAMKMSGSRLRDLKSVPLMEPNEKSFFVQTNKAAAHSEESTTTGTLRVK